MNKFRVGRVISEWDASSITILTFNIVCVRDCPVSSDVWIEALCARGSLWFIYEWIAWMYCPGHQLQCVWPGMSPRTLYWRYIPTSAWSSRHEANFNNRLQYCKTSIWHRKSSFPLGLFGISSLYMMCLMSRFLVTLAFCFHTKCRKRDCHRPSRARRLVAQKVSVSELITFLKYNQVAVEAPENDMFHACLKLKARRNILETFSGTGGTTGRLQS